MIALQCSADTPRARWKTHVGNWVAAMLPELGWENFPEAEGSWLRIVRVDILGQSLQGTVRGLAHPIPAVPDSAQEMQLKVFTEAR
jgi:hypothetical protein